MGELLKLKNLLRKGFEKKLNELIDRKSRKVKDFKPGDDSKKYLKIYQLRAISLKTSKITPQSSSRHLRRLRSSILGLFSKKVIRDNYSTLRCKSFIAKFKFITNFC